MISPRSQTRTLSSVPTFKEYVKSDIESSPHKRLLTIFEVTGENHGAVNKRRNFIKSNLTSSPATRWEIGRGIPIGFTMA
jgi:hypothetical protein